MKKRFYGKYRGTVPMAVGAAILGIGLPYLFPSINRGELYLTLILFAIVWVVLAERMKAKPKAGVAQEQ